MAIRRIIFDTETTGLEPTDGHRIVEIGALEMIDDKLTGNEFHCYLNPERDVPLEAYRVHGLDRLFLQRHPIFSVVAEDFLSFVGDSELIIHNAVFDLKFINYELSLLGKSVSISSDRAIDTLLMARKLFPGQKVNLDSLCRRYDIDISHRKHHGAIKDCHLLYLVYIELTGGRQRSLKISSNNHSSAMFADHMSLKPVKGNKVIITPTEQELYSYNEFIKKIR